MKKHERASVTGPDIEDDEDSDLFDEEDEDEEDDEEEDIDEDDIDDEEALASSDPSSRAVNGHPMSQDEWRAYYERSIAAASGKSAVGAVEDAEDASEEDVPDDATDDHEPLDPRYYPPPEFFGAVTSGGLQGESSAPQAAPQSPPHSPRVSDFLALFGGLRSGGLEPADAATTAERVFSKILESEREHERESDHVHSREAQRCPQPQPPASN